MHKFNNDLKTPPFKGKITIMSDLFLEHKRKGRVLFVATDASHIQKLNQLLELGNPNWHKLQHPSGLSTMIMNLSETQYSKLKKFLTDYKNVNILTVDPWQMKI